ncbi:MAG TPA: histidine kinase dimerization/phosphoacceptor domain -containing protein [Spirochaetia bacterium]|nr:histidine kinase dimerization/phosphoacceptor domain -containing protein [Spirochaetia bacterium]
MNRREHRTILLVEDEFPIALAEARTIEEFGYRVVTAHSGERAVQIATIDSEIALILMDIDLGAGIDGAEAARRILERRNLPVVYLTAHAEQGYVDRVEDFAGYGYVLKTAGDAVMKLSIKTAFALFEANSSASSNEKKYEIMFANIPDVISVVRADGMVKFESSNVKQRFGWTPDDLVDRDVWQLMHPEDLPRLRAGFAAILRQDGAGNTIECRYRCKDGTYRANELTARNLTSDPLINGILVNFHDITDRRIAEEEIKALLAEKDLILKEVHHRIRNNMSTVSSLLSLQAEALVDPAAVSALRDAKARLRSMGLLYDKLFLSENLREMSVRDYLAALVDEIIDLYSDNDELKVEITIADFSLGVKELFSLGIIVNELVTNAVKHAFTGKTDRLIRIAADKIETRVTLVVSDNGNGIPGDFDFEGTTGFGLTLIAGLAKQLDGEVRFERQNGTIATLDFAV